LSGQLARTPNHGSNKKIEAKAIALKPSFKTKGNRQSYQQLAAVRSGNNQDSVTLPKLNSLLSKFDKRVNSWKF